jgi:hypothetical protein
MSALSIIVSGSEPTRLHSALGLAAAHAATGGTARLLFDRYAVPALAAIDAASEAGAMIETCFALGVELVVCQSGLADAGVDAGILDPRYGFGGMVGFVAAADPNRIVLA